MRVPRWVAIGAALVAGMATSACAQSGDPAIDRAQHFYASVSHKDGAAACADLAPEARKALEQQEGKPCAEAILKQGLPDMVGEADVQVFGSMAQVTFPDETAFLSRYGDDWLLVAVGCEPATGDEPHDCSVEVG
ncbi:hypothetical protein DJ010_09260 [Nocardioides silvaticus]|uniref:Lipoprotein n=1 Tax=Nocardioides silvaticus TaxID=2201891 RepID=A0A316TFJ8_9ACTN|nr:hypothetical protein [Nocardioides silvaticus]PWN03293.1 hypothetical protein DJ010_09260 [Nocardioides silvaticus]